MSSRTRSVSPLATNKVGCQCGRDCEMPCWQRVGIAAPCQSCGCSPAPALIDCPYCNGAGEIGYNPSRIGDPQCETSDRCPTCHGEGAVSDRTWEITVCVLCLEHVNDCQCDLDGWQGAEPPTLTLTVELPDRADRFKAALTDIAAAGREHVVHAATKWPDAFITYAVDTAEGALDG